MGVVVHLGSVGFSVLSTAVTGVVGACGQGDKWLRLGRILTPYEAPLCGQILRLCSEYITVVVLDQPNYPAGAGLSDEAVLPACVSFKHIHPLDRFLELRDSVIDSIQLSASHVGRLGLHFHRSQPAPISLSLEDSFFARHTLSTPS